MASVAAGRQWGVIGAGQLRDFGFNTNAIDRWVAAGKLYPKHPGVYTLGHTSVPIEGEMLAAILHAGPGSVLSHATAAWWWGLITDKPSLIDVSTPTRARSTDGVRVHHPRTLDATTHRRFPITTVARTLLDYAAGATVDEVRQALAEAEYRRLLKRPEVEQYLARGRRGAKRLKQALARHQPRLALTRSDLERRFLALCERAGIPLPQVNRQVSRMRIDVVWPQHRIAVELDGYEGHHTPAQMERDRRRELQARMRGYIVVRYTWSQVVLEPDLVLADLIRLFSSAARLAEAGSR
jgi:very-short-patch-repair endonuclease